MDQERIDFIKKQLNDFYFWSLIYGGENETDIAKAHAETNLREIKLVIDMNAILWLGQLIQRVEGVADEQLHNRPELD